MVAKKGIMSGLEDNLNSLENLVLKLESGQLSIDEAIEAYSSGMKLAAKCKKSLDEMTQKVTAKPPRFWRRLPVTPPCRKTRRRRM